MNDKLAQDVLSRLDTIAGKLGVAADHIWGVLVKQAVVSGWTDLALLAVFWVPLLTAQIAGIRWYMKQEKPSDDNFAIPGIPAVMLVVLTIVTLILAPQAIQALINPEYWAFHDLARRL